MSMLSVENFWNCVPGQEERSEDQAVDIAPAKVCTSAVWYHWAGAIDPFQASRGPVILVGSPQLN